MTQPQKELIKSSWTILQHIDPELVGEVFYEKLFSDHPQLQTMFTTNKKEQARKLVAMLSAIVTAIDRPEAVSGMLQKLAQRHVQYGARHEHYPMVGTALLWTLQQGLGTDWNKDVEEAWKACYFFLAAQMAGKGSGKRGAGSVNRES